MGVFVATAPGFPRRTAGGGGAVEAPAARSRFGAAPATAYDDRLVRAGRSDSISIRHLVEYALVRGFAAFVAALGPEHALAAARRAGDLVRLVDRRHRRRAEENLARALPELCEGERARIARESFRSILSVGIELLLLPRVLSPRTFRSRIDTSSVERALERAGGRGALFVGGHLGNWEAFGASIGMLGYPLHSVARPMDNPLLEEFLLSLRTRFGQVIVAKEGAMKTLVKVLRKGGSLGLLIDQDARRHGIFAPFFGRPASTIPTPATLALKLGVPLLTGCCVRTGEGPLRFKTVFDDAVEVDPSADRDEEIQRVTAVVNARLESYVRAYPGQYLWAHRRWKTRPPEEHRGGADA